MTRSYRIILSDVYCTEGSGCGGGGGGRRKAGGGGGKTERGEEKGKEGRKGGGGVTDVKLFAAHKRGKCGVNFS